jgi:long-chain acyl-CoA synthetase
MDDSDPGEHGSEKVRSMQSVLDLGRSNEGLYAERRNALTPDQVACIVYTSGTTGGPKGVMLTHRNLSSQMDSVDLGIGDAIAPGAKVLSLLPTWHAYERTAEYYLFTYGCTIIYTDKRYLKQDLDKVRPHILPCVPRIWESVYEAIHDKVSKAPQARQRLFHFFYGIGLSYVKARRVAKGWVIRRTGNEYSMGAVIVATLKELLLRPLYGLGDRIVFSKLRAAVSGGRLVAAVSGGGSFAAYLDDFFEVVGVPIVNGYGLTETAPVLTIRRIDWNVRGSVGLPIRGTEIEIRSESGEVLPRGKTGVIFGRGPQVMKGYYNNPEATAKVLSEDGWFNTGDLGFMSVDGDIVITGRAKDTIVLSSGENVEPEPIENVARHSPLIMQIVVVGQDQKNLGALVVPNIGPLASALGLPADSSPETVIGHGKAARVIVDEISRALKGDGGFKPSEFVSKVGLIAEPFSDENGMLTQTMKIRRNKVAENYADLIKSLFD